MNERPGACDRCLRRTWLIAALAPCIERAGRRRSRLAELLALSDERLIDALAGTHRAALRAAYGGFDAGAARAACAATALVPLCMHADRYPDRLRQASDPPAVLHVAGDVDRLVRLLAEDPVAVVGARRASPYGLEVARGLGRGLASAGLTVVSGMALGVDSAAHAGALDAGAPTVAVLAGGADRPYPASKRRLYERIVHSGAVVSELPPGFNARRWCFPARNRIIAGLAEATVVVEATERSGSLITAELARDLGREVGAVPGQVSSPLAAGSNALLADGALLVRGAQDVLDALFGAGVRTAVPRSRTAALDPPLRVVLEAVAAGRDSVAALAAAGLGAEAAMRSLAELELLGHLRRAAGGRYVPVA